MKRSFLPILGLILCLSAFFYNIKSSISGVYFIEKPDGIYTPQKQKPCNLMGYTLTAKDCEAQGKSIRNLCPTDTTYGKSCSCDTKFKYTTENCIDNKSLSGDQCDNKYEKCECDTIRYKWTTSNCTAPKTISGNSCNPFTVAIGDINNPSKPYEPSPTEPISVGPIKINSTAIPIAIQSALYYDSCACPSTYSQTCNGNLEGVGTECDGKYASCKCNSSFMLCDNGGAVGADSCNDNEGTKYNSCKQQATCADNGYSSSSEKTGCVCSPVNVDGVGTCYNCISRYEDCKNKGYIYTSVIVPTCNLGSAGNGQYYENTCYALAQECEYDTGKFLHQKGPSSCKCGPNTLYYQYKT
ncbi:MAG: hypothetical protein ACK5N8_08310 [Alphaproteobacteria bacterium]